MAEQARIICVSNRLPVAVSEDSPDLEFRPSSGGLVTAMGPILRKSQGVWIGWPGSVAGSAEEVLETLNEFSAQSEFQLFPVTLDQEAVAGFYYGFSNQIIWPLFHDLQTRCNFDPAFWSSYSRVQELFRDATLAHTKPGDLVWVHDYHLMGLGRALRQAGMINKLCFFLHTPFPCPDIFFKLPWRNDVIEALTSYNLIGFQTKRDLANFIECAELLTSTPCIARGSQWAMKFDKRECLMGCFPISIDCNEFEELARNPEVEQKARTIKADMHVEFLVLSIDRLDYTKGIPHRIKAFSRLLELEPSLKKRVALLQVVVPSRVEVPEYQQLRSEIEQLVTALNGLHGEPGWVPVHHLFRSLVRDEVIAMYRAADVALVTPLKDGMNLVAKEYCTSRVDGGGMLVLSEFAGAADEFCECCFLVNPYDLDGVARALMQAFAMPKEQARANMQNLRQIISKFDVFSWAKSFLNAAGWEWRSFDLPPRPPTIWEKLRRMANVFDI